MIAGLLSFISMAASPLLFFALLSGCSIRETGYTTHPDKRNSFFRFKPLSAHFQQHRGSTRSLGTPIGKSLADHLVETALVYADILAA